MASHNRLDVIIIDDTPEMTRLLALALEEPTYQVKVVGSISEAIEISTESSVIVSDCRIPELMLRDIQRRTCDTPIVLISPRGVQTRDVNGVIFLAKPFELDDLFGAIAKAAKRCDLQPHPCNLQP